MGVDVYYLVLVGEVEFGDFVDVDYFGIVYCYVELVEFCGDLFDYCLDVVVVVDVDFKG